MSENEEKTPPVEQESEETPLAIDICAEYLTRIILSEYPETAEKLRNGEFISIDEAAVDAGIVNRASEIDEKLESVLAPWKHSDAETRELFVKLALKEMIEFLPGSIPDSSSSPSSVDNSQTPVQEIHYKSDEQEPKPFTTEPKSEAPDISTKQPAELEIESELDTLLNAEPEPVQTIKPEPLPVSEPGSEVKSGLEPSEPLKDVETGKAFQAENVLAETKKKARWKALEEKLRQDTKIPTLPVIFNKVQKITNDPNSDIEALNKVLSADPAFTTTILRLANSAHYSLGNVVKTLRMALIVLGFNEITRLVTTVGVVNVFPRNESGENFSYDAFWIHSASVAAAAEAIAEFSKKEDPDELYMSGLLHDIGIIFLASNFNQETLECQEHAVKNELPYWRAEQQLFGTDHSRVGAFLAKSWKFPELLVESIRYHHEPWNVKTNQTAIAIVYLANLLCPMRAKDDLKMVKIERLKQNRAWTLITAGLELSDSDIKEFHADMYTRIIKAREFMKEAIS